MMAIRRKLFKCNIDNFFIGNNCARLFSTVFKTDENVNRFEEVKIPVPWGHVAAKWWGPQDKRPILVLHGWQVKFYLNISVIFKDITMKIVKNVLI